MQAQVLFHLSFVATPHENTSATKQARCFLWVDGSEKIMDDVTNWRPTNSSIPRKSSTDWRVCGTPSWLNTRSTTWSHSLQYKQFMVCTPRLTLNSQVS